MLHRISYIIIFLLMVHVIHLQAQNILSGSISNEKDGSALVGATVSIPDLKLGTISDADGNYKIQITQPGTYLIQVSCLGFATVARSIDVKGNVQRNFTMNATSIEQSEVVVTGVSVATEIRRTPAPMKILSKQLILESGASNLVEAMATVPGISALSTGPGISKPQIRGLGYNRVIVIHDGIRQEGQQWGDEHGLEIDEFSVSKIEVLKGPGSLMYGSDAMAGVINILSADPPASGMIAGNFQTYFHSNNALSAVSADLSGNQNGFVWLARASARQAHDYQNKFDGFVYNSGFKDQSLGGYLGLNKKWGYSHLNFSYYRLHVELPEGERDSTGAFLKPVAVSDTSMEEWPATVADFKSYDIDVPNQIVNHYGISWMNNVYFKKSKLFFNIGFENNQRREYGNPLQAEKYGLYFFLNTIPYSLRFTFPQVAGWNITLGGNGMYQQNQNKGIEYLIPEYHLFDAGLFVFLQKSFKALTLTGGLRGDNRSITSQELYLDENDMPAPAADPNAIIKFPGFNTDFKAWSASAGVSYEISKRSIVKFNTAKGFRAPNIAELGSNGRHEGTFRYEVGNPGLKAEGSLQFDGGFEYHAPYISAGASLFNNIVSNYIFPEKINSIAGGDSLIFDEDENEALPVFRYVQTNANLFGGEIFVDIHPYPLDWVHFENSFSYVRGLQTGKNDSSENLPFIPQPKIYSELRFTKTDVSRWLDNSYFFIAMEYHFPQNNIYGKYDTETVTEEYMLINASAGTDVIIKKAHLFSMYLTATNLLNTAYQDHLSRLKYAPENIATQRTGIFNKGRNIVLKLIIPINIKK